eukprot:scaffold7716_cov102-Isochrysis_galbana.AAC.1
MKCRRRPLAPHVTARPSPAQATLGPVVGLRAGCSRSALPRLTEAKRDPFTVGWGTSALLPVTQASVGLLGAATVPLGDAA